MSKSFSSNPDAIYALMSAVALKPNRFDEMDKIMLVCSEWNEAGKIFKKGKLWQDLKRRDERNANMWKMLKSKRISGIWENTSWPNMMMHCGVLHAHLDRYKITRDDVALPPGRPGEQVESPSLREVYENFFTNEILNIMKFLQKNEEILADVTVYRAALMTLCKIMNLIPWITTAAVRLQLVHLLVKQLKDFERYDIFETGFVKLTFRVLDFMLTKEFIKENAETINIHTDPMFMALESILFASIRGKHLRLAPNDDSNYTTLIDSLSTLVVMNLVNTDTFVTRVEATMSDSPHFTHGLVALLVLYATTPERKQDIMKTTIVDTVLLQISIIDGYNSVMSTFERHRHYVDLLYVILTPRGANLQPKQRIQVLNFCVHKLVYLFEERAIVPDPLKAYLRSQVVKLMSIFFYKNATETKTIAMLQDDIMEMPTDQSDVMVKYINQTLILASVYRAQEHMSLSNTMFIIDRWLDKSDEQVSSVERTHGIEVLVKVSEEDNQNPDIIQRILKFMAVPMFHTLIARRHALSLEFMLGVKNLHECSIAALLEALDKFKDTDVTLHRHQAHEILCRKFKEVRRRDFNSEMSIWEVMRLKI
jgi:hypothetical protein